MIYFEICSVLSCIHVRYSCPNSTWRCRDIKLPSKTHFIPITQRELWKCDLGQDNVLVFSVVLQDRPRNVARRSMENLKWGKKNVIEKFSSRDW